MLIALSYAPATLESKTHCTQEKVEFWTCTLYGPRCLSGSQTRICVYRILSGVNLFSLNILVLFNYSRSANFSALSIEVEAILAFPCIFQNNLHFVLGGGKSSIDIVYVLCFASYICMYNYL